MGEADVDPKAIELHYDEAKERATSLDDVLKQYRSNATTILALATGAATFFGLSSSAKGWWYVAALVAYGIGAIAAAAIFMPQAWRVGPVEELRRQIETNPAMTVDQARWDLGIRYSEAFQENLKATRTKAAWTRVLLTATAAVIICAGINTTQEKPQAPTEPTRVILEEAD